MTSPWDQKQKISHFWTTLAAHSDVHEGNVEGISVTAKVLGPEGFFFSCFLQWMKTRQKQQLTSNVAQTQASRPPEWSFHVQKLQHKDGRTLSNLSIWDCFHTELNAFCRRNVSVDSTSQSQSRLVLHVTGSGGGGGLSLSVEFQEAGFLYRDSNSHLAVGGIFQRGQCSFLWSFGRLPLPVNRNQATRWLLNKTSVTTTSFQTLC